MDWTDKILKTLTTFGPPEQWVYASHITELLNICAEKHAGHPHRGAEEDIKHALEHIRAVRVAGDLYATDQDTGRLHMIHAATDCLLAFGALLGLIEGTKGETLGVGYPK